MPGQICNRPPGYFMSGTAEPTVDAAAAAIRAGRLVAFPTDTVYALACAWNNPVPLAAMFATKRRNAAKAIPILVSDPRHVSQVGCTSDPKFGRLIHAFWPGALTIVIPARTGTPDAIRTANATGQATVAVRMPNHPLALAIIESAGGAVAATSANLSGARPGAGRADIEASFGDALSVIVEPDGPASGVASTIVQITDDHAAIVRAGGVSEASIRAAMNGTFTRRA